MAAPLAAAGRSAFSSSVPRRRPPIQSTSSADSSMRLKSATLRTNAGYTRCRAIVTRLFDGGGLTTGDMRGRGVSPAHRGTSRRRGPQWSAGGRGSSLSGHSLQFRAPCRKDWLFVRKEALVSSDGAASAHDPTAPIGTDRSGARPGEVRITRTSRTRGRVGS
jgi:hypothetical protein